MRCIVLVEKQNGCARTIAVKQVIWLFNGEQAMVVTVEFILRSRFEVTVLYSCVG